MRGWKSEVSETENEVYRMLLALSIPSLVPQMTNVLDKQFVGWSGGANAHFREGERVELHHANFNFSKMRKALKLPEVETNWYSDNRPEELKPPRKDMIGPYYKLTDEEAGRMRQAFTMMAHPLSLKPRRDALVRMQVVCASALRVIEEAVDLVRDEIDKRAIGTEKAEYTEIRRQIWFFNYFRGRMLQGIKKGLADARWAVADSKLLTTLEKFKALTKMGERADLPRYTKPYVASSRVKYLPAGAPRLELTESTVLEMLEESLKDFTEQPTPLEAMMSQKSTDAVSKLMDDIAKMDGLADQSGGAAVTAANLKVKEELAHQSSLGRFASNQFDACYSDRFDGGRFLKGGDLAILSWQKLCAVAETNDIFHLLQHEAYRGESLFELERGTAQALVCLSVSLKCLTDYNQFGKFFSAGSPKSSYVNQPASIYKFFSDLVLYSIAAGLKDKPALKKAVFEWLPNPANADMSKLKEAIETSDWLNGRRYAWNEGANRSYNVPWSLTRTAQARSVTEKAK